MEYDIIFLKFQLQYLKTFIRNPFHFLSYPRCLALSPSRGKQEEKKEPTISSDLATSSIFLLDSRETNKGRFRGNFRGLVRGPSSGLPLAGENCGPGRAGSRVIK